MDGLDQVSEDPGCFDGSALHQPAPGLSGSSQTPFEPRVVDRWLRIARTIEGEVIPRLMLAHRADLRTVAELPQAVEFDADMPEKLARIVLEQHDDAALGFVHSLLQSGLPLESVYLDLLAPAARWLGHKWTEDELSFTDVTLALSRLQRLMRTLATSSQSSATADRRGSVLLAAIPGDQHLFGVLMLEEFFRRDGWEVNCLPGVPRDVLIDTVRRTKPQVVGLSAAVDEDLRALRTLIEDVRSAGGRRRQVVMVGGRVFNENPDLVADVGADFTAVDGREAIRHIHYHLSNSTNSRLGQ